MKEQKKSPVGTPGWYKQVKKMLLRSIGTSGGSRIFINKVTYAPHFYG